MENSREPPDDALYCLIIFLSGSGSAAATSQTIQPQSYTNSPSVVGANVYHRFVRIKQMLNLMLKQHYNTNAFLEKTGETALKSEAVLAQQATTVNLGATIQTLRINQSNCKLNPS